jgi:hypothetical protein
LDLLLIKDGRRSGVEIKRADAPKLAASMKTAMQDLKLDQLSILYPGTQTYSLAESVVVTPISSLFRERQL